MGEYNSVALFYGIVILFAFIAAVVTIISIAFLNYILYLEKHNYENRNGNTSDQLHITSDKSIHPKL